MSASEIIENIKALPPDEREKFAQVYGKFRLEESETISERPVGPEHFLERLRARYGDRLPPGTPCSQIVIEGRR